MPDRRTAMLMLAGASSVPGTAFASTPREVMWDDLIPPGIPYSEIIGDGFIDYEQDLWNPQYDENATKLNETLNGALIRMPGYIIPLELNAKGVTEFILVPYVGACIHVPPPPANQLVMVYTEENPWPSDELWEAVWVTGTMRTKLQESGLGQTGYALSAEHIEVFTW